MDSPKIELNKEFFKFGSMPLCLFPSQTHISLDCFTINKNECPGDFEAQVAAASEKLISAGYQLLHSDVVPYPIRLGSTSFSKFINVKDQPKDFIVIHLLNFEPSQNKSMLFRRIKES